MSARRVLRPSVLRRIPIDRHTVIEASAGTGKTFTLEHLVIELLLTADVRLEEILVVTFTEKATNELRQRVRAAIEELLSGACGGEPTTADGGTSVDSWTIDDAARSRLTRALHAFDGATIATIHSFCQRVLRENAFSSGRLFEEHQVDGREAFGRALRDALRRDVACGPGGVWLQAALGAGWSMDRLEELLWSCAQAKAELRPLLAPARLEAALAAFPVEDARWGCGPSEIKGWGLHAQTAKAIGARLAEMADAVEASRASRGVASYALRVQDAKFAYLVDKLGGTARPGTAGRVCAAAVELAWATPTFSSGLAQTLLPPVRTELVRRKRENGEYDFDDMLALVDEALQSAQAESLVAAMRARWRYVLIDEFQDTDETQWSIFRRAFFGDGPTSSVLYLVGDPKQSIYRFRGADVHTYLRARDEIAAAGGERVTLDENYRATARLVDATNALFDRAAAEPLFSGSIEYTPVTCGRPLRTLVDGDGGPVSPVHVLRFGGEGPDPIPLGALGTRIAREIRTLTDPARPFCLDGRPLGHHDVFLLTRNAREGRTLGAALRAGGVPYAFYKEDGLFQTDEAREVRALLVAIDDPTDQASRLAAWLTPFFGLPLASLERARDLPGSSPLLAQLHAWKTMADARDFDRLFESLLSDSGVVRRELFFSAGERELTNYLHVLESLLEHARHTQATLRDLIHELSGLIERTRLPLDLEGNVQRLESERRAVQIMTIHKAKGLEAPVVFVAGGFKGGRGDEVRVYHEAGRRLAWVGRLDDSPAEGQVKREEDEEEQRLMYVALTRAQGRLYLPCAVEDAGARGGTRAAGDAKRLRGPYDRVNRRVARLLREGEPSLSVEDVVVVERPDEPSTAAGAHNAGETSAWTPPAALLRAARDEAAYATLRERRAGAFVTSYTRMKTRSGPAGVASVDDPGEGRREKAADTVDEPSATSLRAARTSGIFLHELLERVPVASFAAASFEPWRGRPEVSSLVAEALAIHRIDPSQREHAEQMVWTAYTTPLQLPDGGRVDGVARAARVVREMDFVFPIPDPDEGTLALGASRGGSSPRGYLRGSIDLAFEQAGVTYFVDWKSDSLESFEPEALARHVRAFYEEQAQLYTLAIVKLLGIGSREEHAARFGGVLYCFLRGMAAPGAPGRGVWTLRPSWDDVLGWERALRGRRLEVGRRGERAADGSVS